MAEKENPVENSAQNAENGQDKPRLTIRQLREAAQKETLAKELAKANQSPREHQVKAAAATPKKKSSILGGLFQVREPTQIALNQVAAQMIAQHGSTCPTKVPNVRLEKMPDFVPKVNSKWDGIPESTKQKERKDKDKARRLDIRESFFNTDSKSGSDDCRPYRNSRNSSSTTGSSFGAYGDSSGSQGTSSRSRFYAQSVNSSGDLASQQRTDTSQFSRSPTSYSAEDSIAEELVEAQHWLGLAGAEPRSRNRRGFDRDLPKSSASKRASINRPVSTQSYQANTDFDQPRKSPATNRPPGSPTASADGTGICGSIDWAQVAQTLGAPSIHSVAPPSIHTSRSLRNPSWVIPSQNETSKSTPTRDEMSLQMALHSPTRDASDTSTARKKKSKTPISEAFLAGEAQELVLHEESRGDSRAALSTMPLQPGQRTWDSGRSRVQQDLEKRPDSSRDRLGLRASMLFTDERPWEKQQAADGPPPSPGIEQHMNPKTKFSKPFGKFGK